MAKIGALRGTTIKKEGPRLRGGKIKGREDTARTVYVSVWKKKAATFTVVRSVIGLQEGSCASAEAFGTERRAWFGGKVQRSDGSRA